MYHNLHLQTLIHIYSAAFFFFQPTVNMDEPTADLSHPKEEDKSTLREGTASLITQHYARDTMVRWSRGGRLNGDASAVCFCVD